MTSSSVDKIEIRRRRENIQRDGMFFCTITCDGALPPGDGFPPREIVDRFLVLLVCMVFALPVELSISQPMSFLAFTLLILSLILLVGE